MNWPLAFLLSLIPICFVGGCYIDNRYSGVQCSVCSLDVDSPGFTGSHTIEIDAEPHTTTYVITHVK